MTCSGAEIAEISAASEKAYKLRFQHDQADRVMRQLVLATENRSVWVGVAPAHPRSPSLTFLLAQ